MMLTLKIDTDEAEVLKHSCKGTQQSDLILSVVERSQWLLVLAHLVFQSMTVLAQANKTNFAC